MESVEFQRRLQRYATKLDAEGGPGEGIAEEATAFLDRYFVIYLQSTPDECSTIRASFYGNRAFENLLFAYTRRAADRLQLTGDENWLWRGLVSISLEDSGIDYRDSLKGLAELYVASERHRLDPKIAFAKVADLSSKEEPRGGKVPMYRMMAEFEHSAILQERRKMQGGYWE